MLDGHDDQHQRHADQEGRVEVQGTKAGNGQSKGFEHPEPGGHCSHAIGGGHSVDGVRSRDTGVGGHIINHRLGFSGVAGDIRRDPVNHLLAFGQGDREKRVQNVARRDGAAERQHGRPCEPVAPHREGRDQLGIAQPCGCAIDGRAARLVAEHPGHFGIGKALQEAHHHRDHPDREGQLARGSGDATD